ncbi:MAG: hypothetical protein R3B09_08765 [Nannocystaceae bacterium]
MEQGEHEPGEGKSYLDSVLEDLESLHPSLLRGIKDNVKIVAFVATEINSGKWGNEKDGRLGKALAAVRHSTEKYTTGFDREAYHAKEGPRVIRQWRLESNGKKSITFYPAVNPGDPPLKKQDADLKTIVNDRVAGKWTDIGTGADKFETVVEIIRRLRDVTPSGNFLREIVLTGHGVTEARLDGTTDAGFEFGTEWIDTGVVASYPSNYLKNSLAPGATIDLQGCDIAQVDSDRRFRWELGRVFFGEKNWGYIKAYGTVTGQHHGLSRKSLTGPDPEVLVWPVDFPQYREMKKKAKQSPDDPTP